MVLLVPKKGIIGNDPLEVRLNPSTGTVKITSTKNSGSEFLVTIKLHEIPVRTGYQAMDKTFPAQLSGSLVSQGAMICEKSDSDLIRALQKISENNPSLGEEMLFRTGLEILEAATELSKANVIDSQIQQLPLQRGDFGKQNLPENVNKSRSATTTY